MSREKQIFFFGTPELAAAVLETLITQYPNTLVVTQPDKPVGRKQTLTPSPVKLLARKHQLPIHDYLNPEEITDLLKKYQPDLSVVAAFGGILPLEIIEIPKFKTIGVHPSLLPKYRGATPVRTAILNGDEETGVSIFLIDEKVDHGPILAQEKTPISSQGTTITLKKKLAKLAGKLLVKTIPDWFQGKIKACPQNDQKASFTKLLTKKDGFVDWERFILATKNADKAKTASTKIDRMIRAYTPWPGVWTTIKKGNKNLKILKAHLEEGRLVPDQVQLEGKRPISWKNFCRGYSQLIN